jgi:hypothetical protein
VRLDAKISEIEEFHSFYDYWQDLRGDILVPYKSDFDPLKIRTHMGRMTLCQLVPPDGVIVRLMASGLAEHSNIEKTGHNLLDSVQQSQKPLVYNAFDAVCTAPCVSRTLIIRHFEDDLTAKSHSLYFPFIGAEGETDIIISVDKHVNDPSDKYIGDCKEKYMELAELDFFDIGAGMPNWSFNATPSNPSLLNRFT